MRKTGYIALAAAILHMSVLPAAEAKKADLAGAWYSASPAALRSEIEEYLSRADVKAPEGEIVGGIVPHAGMRYSGPVAAYAYAVLRKTAPDTVIVVGFSHRKHMRGLVSVFTDREFVTPLGAVDVDMDITGRLLAQNERIQDIPQIFASENSIEMQIPFIQVAVGEAKIVLVALCDQSLDTCRVLAAAIADVMRDRKGVVVLASSDMSHFLPYGEARELDERTAGTIESFDPDAFYLESYRARHSLMCGYGAAYTVMEASRRLGAGEAEVLKYANSGDVTGSKDSVVGYLSALFVRSEGAVSGGAQKKEVSRMFDQAQREELLKMARDTIRHYLRTGERLEVQTDDEALKQDMGAFVTLNRHGRLRGCIGHMVASGPLHLTVRDMAIAAAVEDPRFPAMTAEELDEVDIEISVLSPMKRVYDPDEIVAGKHGVMVRSGWRSGVYLPQVADEAGWDRDQFMNSLCAHKAGIPADAWKTGKCEMYVFTAEVFGEKE